MKTEQDIYGIRAILEAITKEKTIDKIWLLKGQKGTLFKSLEKKIYELGISHSYVPKERLDRFSKQNHQGAIARIAPIQFESLENRCDVAMKSVCDCLWQIYEMVMTPL